MYDGCVWVKCEESGGLFVPSGGPLRSERLACSMTPRMRSAPRDTETAGCYVTIVYVYFAADT